MKWREFLRNDALSPCQDFESWQGYLRSRRYAHNYQREKMSLFAISDSFREFFPRFSEFVSGLFHF